MATRARHDAIGQGDDQKQHQLFAVSQAGARIGRQRGRYERRARVHGQRPENHSVHHAHINKEIIPKKKHHLQLGLFEARNALRWTIKFSRWKIDV